MVFRVRLQFFPFVDFTQFRTRGWLWSLGMRTISMKCAKKVIERAFFAEILLSRTVFFSSGLFNWFFNGMPRIPRFWLRQFSCKLQWSVNASSTMRMWLNEHKTPVCPERRGEILTIVFKNRAFISICHRHNDFIWSGAECAFEWKIKSI